MIRKSLLLALVFAFALAGPVFAGGKHYDCDASTDDCLAHMAGKFQERGWVGIEYDNDEDTGALTISKVVPDGPAYKANMRSGDQLLAVNGVAFADNNEKAMKKATEKWTAGTTVTYTVRRGTSEMPIYVTLGEIPKDVMASWVGKHMVEHHMPTKMAKN